MKTKILSVILSGLLLFVMTPNIYADAAEESYVTISSTENGVSVYAAGLISDCALSCTGGSKTIYINAEIYGTAKMAKIGFKNIKVQKSSDNQNWSKGEPVSDMISENAYQKIVSRYAVSVEGGYYYRIVLDNYAKEDTWWFPDTQTVEAISNSVWVP